MTVDTNILIAYCNGDPTVIEWLDSRKQESRALFISSLSITELLSFPPLSLAQTEYAKAFLRYFISIPVGDELAETAAWFRKLYRLTTPDAVIAATALLQKTPLVTRDRQFLKLKEITIVQI
jgi:hypothetical protein